jgi:vitamin B12 transport system permease protein
MSARALFSALFALVSAAMLGLAFGAVWMIPTLFFQQVLPWLALPVGWVLGRMIRGWVRPERRGAAALAALATALACVYVGVLTAAARVAGLMGMGLVEAMKTAGAGLLLDLVRLNLAGADVAWFAAGIACSAWVAWRSSPRRQG